MPSFATRSANHARGGVAVGSHRAPGGRRRLAPDERERPLERAPQRAEVGGPVGQLARCRVVAEARCPTGGFVGGRVEQRVLRREVAVDRRDRDPAAPGDFGHRDVARRIVGAELEDGRQDALPGHLALQVAYGHEMTISY